MKRAHLVIPASSFVAGAASDVLGVAPIFLAVIVALALLARVVPSGVRANVVAAAAFGILDGVLRGHVALPEPDRHFQRLPVVVVEARASDLDRSEVTVRLADGALATLSLSGSPPTVGSRLLVRAKREPFDAARNPGEPSLRELEAERGVRWHLERARILAQAPPDPRDATLWIPRARAWASARLHATLGEPDATILAGAMWGERGTLPPALRAEFQDTGTVHVLVTAGLHLGVVAALALGLLHGLRCNRASASLGTIVVVWLYAALSGAHLPAVRAATMLTFALLARASGREATSWNALAAAAFVVVAVRPQSVTSVSFALSFSCVAAIFAFAEPLARGFARIGAPGFAGGALAVSLAAQIGTWPLTAATFLVIAPYAPLANVFVVPVVGIAMLVGFVALALGSVGPLAAVIPLASVATNIETSLVDFIVFAVREVGSLPGAHAIATPPPLWTIVVYDLACAGAAFAFARARIALTVALVAGASALCLWPPRTPSHHLVVTAIDVGQADALLVQTPHGHAFLVDGGGRLERGASRGSDSAAEAVGERVVVPFLIRAGIHHLDAVLLSHPHGDHAGGIPPVLRELGAETFADSGQRYAGHAYADALAVARDRRVPIRTPRSGDVWKTDDGVTLRFYGPTLPFIAGGRNDINDNSLVFRLEYGSFRMLFTGDAGVLAERRMLASGVDLRADVLKIGHHGSAYSSSPEFLDAVAPRDAVISVGRHNLFGHPAPSTIEALARRRVRVYRTDEDGAVRIESDGRSFKVAGFL